MQEIKLLILALSAVVATITDLKSGLIKNWLTLPLWFSGLIYSFYLNGFNGLISALGAGLLVVITTFRFSTPGGGDIKLGLGVGAWIGVNGWPPYFIGAALTRIILSLIVKLKIYTPQGFLNGLKLEMVTFQMPPAGERNFAIFQNAAKSAGYNGDAPVVPGALWVAGGVFAYIIAALL
ncbi:MAG: prepilin peptidase [Thermosipho sp. (in: Bacteria)]|nr:prepilin peptidase [Thermosipho sp. (in: thermotogales)]